MDDQLIKAVHKREAIWNPEHKLYRHVPTLIKLWREVSKELGVNEKLIKCKWRNMRAYFVKELKRMKPRRDNRSCDCMPKNNWVHFDKLRFLDKTLSSIELDNKESESRCTKRILSTVEKIAYESDSCANETEAPVKKEPSSPNLLDHDLSGDEIREAIPSPASPKGENMEGSEASEIESEEESKTKKNSDMLFFESLLPYLEEIPMARKLKLRSKIQDLIVTELETAPSPRLCDN